MSYRELRNFTEILRFLGYQRQVSIENFKTPNFQLVAEILQWFVKRFDPDHDISLQIETEQDRIIFIKTTCLFLLQKARLKINPKKLYQADGYAVQELLKIATLLYKSVQQSDSNVDEDEANINLAELRNTVHTKLDQLRQSRQTVSEITDKGALLYDLLSKEVDLKEQRSLALAKPLEMNDVRKSLKLAVKAVEDEVKQLNQNLDNIAADETALDAKIEKKKTELERQQKRLAQIQAVRPAYMDEYEKYEDELKRLYAIYVQKYRNLAFLQHMQANYDKIQMEKAAAEDAKLKALLEKMREEEKARLAEMDKFEAENQAAERLETDVKGRTLNVYGNVTGAGLSDEEDDLEASHGFTSDDDEDVDDEEDLLQPSVDHQPAGQGNNAKFGSESTAKQVLRSAGSKFGIIDSSPTARRPPGSANRLNIDKVDNNLSEDELVEANGQKAAEIEFVEQADQKKGLNDDSDDDF